MKNYLFCTVVFFVVCGASALYAAGVGTRGRREKRVTESSIINGLRSGRREPMMYAASVAGRFVKGNPQSAIKIYRALVNAIDDTRISCCCKPPLEEIEGSMPTDPGKTKITNVYISYIREHAIYSLGTIALASAKSRDAIVNFLIKQNCHYCFIIRKAVYTALGWIVEKCPTYVSEIAGLLKHRYAEETKDSVKEALVVALSQVVAVCSSEAEDVFEILKKFKAEGGLKYIPVAQALGIFVRGAPTKFHRNVYNFLNNLIQEEDPDPGLTCAFAESLSQLVKVNGKTYARDVWPLVKTIAEPNDRKDILEIAISPLATFVQGAPELKSRVFLIFVNLIKKSEQRRGDLFFETMLNILEEILSVSDEDFINTIKDTFREQHLLACISSEQWQRKFKDVLCI